MNHVTPDDISVFATHLKAWQTKLNLADWRVVLSDLHPKGVMAQMDKWDWKQRQVTCRIGLDWKATPVNSKTLEQTALHELLHVLLYELIQCAQTPSVSADDLGSIEHRIINTLEGLLVPLEGQQ